MGFPRYRPLSLVVVEAIAFREAILAAVECYTVAGKKTRQDIQEARRRQIYEIDYAAMEARIGKTSQHASPFCMGRTDKKHEMVWLS